MSALMSSLSLLPNLRSPMNLGPFLVGHKVIRVCTSHITNVQSIVYITTTVFSQDGSKCCREAEALQRTQES